jgi:hypothetical protein
LTITQYLGHLNLLNLSSTAAFSDAGETSRNWEHKQPLLPDPNIDQVSQSHRRQKLAGLLELSLLPQREDIFTAGNDFVTATPNNS